MEKIEQKTFGVAYDDPKNHLLDLTGTIVAADEKMALKLAKIMYERQGYTNIRIIPM